MYIVYETGNDINELRSKYLVLELDTLELSDGNTIATYAVVDKDCIVLQEITILDNLKRLHEGLIRNYHKRNWKYCRDAIEHLQGKFKGELDSFYAEFLTRIEILENAELPSDWTGNIKLTTQ